METTARLARKVEFGDFQTPLGLARRVADRVADLGFTPASIVEPTCGVGNMLFAAVDRFPDFQRALGIEVQPRYLETLEERREGRADSARVSVALGNFFEQDWSSTLAALPGPLLVIGNPPWVTNAQLSAGGSDNLPEKSNFQKHAGMDAITGKSNFDISEAVLLRLVDALSGRDAVLAVLCKTAVARKILDFAWRKAAPISDAEIHRIDSNEHFDASVDACLLIVRFGRVVGKCECRVFSAMGATAPEQTLGFRDGRLVADATAYDRWKHLQGDGPYRWRSGIKHDCSDVMELVRCGDELRTRNGERLELEYEALFPMLKASDLANGKPVAPMRWMVVPQRATGEETARLARTAPNTWAYLMRHAERLDRRASVIYKGRPRFSVFGVGEYSFAPWKVAIAGLYKKLSFRVVGSFQDKPVVFDDTCYFVPCKTEREASLVAACLESDEARAFFSAFIFWDAKRPVTVDVLARLDISKLARELGQEAEFAEVCCDGGVETAALTAGTLWAK